MKNSQKIKVHDHHRNGICGAPFRVAIVEETENGVKREMLVIRFYDDSECFTAAFDLALLDKRDIASMSNSWRGDHYDEIMKDFTKSV